MSGNFPSMRFFLSSRECISLEKGPITMLIDLFYSSVSYIVLETSKFSFYVANFSLSDDANSGSFIDSEIILMASSSQLWVQVQLALFLFLHLSKTQRHMIKSPTCMLPIVLISLGQIIIVYLQTNASLRNTLILLN